MVPAFVRQAMIPLVCAGIALGIYDAVSGSPVAGAVVAVVSAVAGGLATARLRATRQWPFR